MRVLLVEDEADLGGAIKRTLTQHKYLVDWVLDGTDAWAYLENSWTQYILAIFDMICNEKHDQSAYLTHHISGALG